MGIVLELEDITIAGPKSRVNSRASVPSKSFSPDNTSLRRRESLLIYLYLSWTISLKQRINRRRLHLEDNHSMMTSSVRNNSHRVIQSSPVLFSSSSSGLDFSKTRARTRWIVFSHKHTHKYKYMHINHL